MLKLLHTADWQIGLKAAHVAAVAGAVRQARLDAARAAIDAANAATVDAVVLAGDTFEDNLVDDRLVAAVVDCLAASRAPVFVLPGNHDALTADSVFRRASWRARPSHVHLLDERRPYPLGASGGVLLPSPAAQKKSLADPVASLPYPPSGCGPIVGVAHGSLRIEGKYSLDDFPIAPGAAAARQLDYLALGHWHGLYVHEGRTAYPGTHETTRFGEDRSGQVLLVEIDAPGAIPRLTPVPTARLRWETLELDLFRGAAEEAERVRREAGQWAEPTRTLLRLRTTGPCPAGAERELEELADGLQASLLHVVRNWGHESGAQVDERMARAAAASPLVRGLLDDLADPSHGNDDARNAARQLLVRIVFESQP